MKFITNDALSELTYPIGQNIGYNMERIKLMAALIKKTKEFKGHRINLACSGSSGAIIAAIIAAKLPNCIISHVKKQGESAHSTYIEYRSSDIVIMVDDFMSSGATLNYIYEQLGQKWDIKHVHGLILTSSVNTSRLNFKPDVIIAYSVI